MRVFVTSAAGFAGSAIGSEARNVGHPVVCLSQHRTTASGHHHG